MSIPTATTSWSDLTDEQRVEFRAWLDRRKTEEEFSHAFGTTKEHVVTDRCGSCLSNTWNGVFGDEARREALAAQEANTLQEWERALMEPIPAPPEVRPHLTVPIPVGLRDRVERFIRDSEEDMHIGIAAQNAEWFLRAVWLVRDVPEQNRRGTDYMRDEDSDLLFGVERHRELLRIRDEHVRKSADGDHILYGAEGWFEGYIQTIRRIPEVTDWLLGQIPIGPLGYAPADDGADPEADARAAQEQAEREAARILEAKEAVANHYGGDTAWLDDNLDNIRLTLDYFISYATGIAEDKNFCSEFDRVARLVGIKSTSDRRYARMDLPVRFQIELVPDVLLHGIASAVAESGYTEQYGELTSRSSALGWPVMQERGTHYDITYSVEVHHYDRDAGEDEIIEAIRNGAWERINVETADCDDAEAHNSFDYDTADARQFMNDLAILGVAL